MTVMLGQAKQW